MNWYKRNEMVANPDKFQLIFFGLKEDHDLCIDIFFIQYKNFTKTRYLRLYLQTTGRHNKDVDPGKQGPMTIPKGHYMKH